MNTYEDNKRNPLAYQQGDYYNRRLNRWESNAGVRLADVHRLQPVRERHNVQYVIKNNGTWSNINGEHNLIRQTQKLHLRASL